MKRPDPTALTVWNTTDVCQTVAGRRRDTPILIRNWRELIAFPPLGVRPGDPVVYMGVMSDGVVIVAALHNQDRLFGHEFVEYPTAEGEPIPSAVRHPSWIAEVDAALVKMIEVLRGTGMAVA